MFTSPKSSRTRRSQLDAPPIVLTMREFAVKRAVHPNSHRFSCRTLADEIDLRHGVRVAPKTVRTQLKRPGLYHLPWSRRAKRPCIGQSEPMADIADIAQNRSEREAPYLLAANRRSAGPLANGKCHDCDEPVGRGMRWCPGAECRESRQKKQGRR